MFDLFLDKNEELLVAYVVITQPTQSNRTKSKVFYLLLFSIWLFGIHFKLLHCDKTKILGNKII